MAQPPSFPTMLEGLKFKPHQHQNGAGQEGVNVTKKLGGAERSKIFPVYPRGMRYSQDSLWISPWDLHSSYFSSCLFHQPLQPNSQNRMQPPLFSCSSPASSFPACNARVVFKTNENGTQEAEWIHLALCYPLPGCYLFLCISLEATFVNMAAEEPQARENFFFLYKTNNLSSRRAVFE